MANFRKQKIKSEKSNLTSNSSSPIRKKRKGAIKNDSFKQKSDTSRKTAPHPPPLLLEDPLQCDDCTSTFNNNVDFAFHSLVHSKDNKYTCHLCNYRNSYKYKIGIHVRTHEGTNKFKCEICGKGFMGQKQAEEHKNFHTGEMPFQCEICGRYFMFSSRLASHRRSYHYEVLTGKPLVKFDCIECKKHYKSAEGLRTHIIKIHKADEIDLTVICEICGKKLANKKRLKFHLRIHTGYKPYACHICPKNFSKKDQLVEHIRTHTGERPYVCKLCGKGFAQRTPLKTHEKTHNVDRPGNACNLCRFVFKSKVELEYHSKLCYSGQTDFSKTYSIQSTEKYDNNSIFANKETKIFGNNKKRIKQRVETARKQSHHPPPLELDEPIKCDDCNGEFKTNVAFAYHSIAHSEDAKYSCHLCEYRSSYKYQIGIHIRTHEGTTKFKCEICNKPFMVRKHAIEHKHFHTGEKPFQCDVCGKNFMFSWRLTAHMKTFHYETIMGKPLVKFDCFTCNKHYRSASGLRTHNIKIHKSNNIDLTVICEICGKKLANRERLKFHLRIHTGYKPHACHVCPKRFSKKDQLVEHIRTHTGERPYVCKLCGKGFAQRTPLKTHEKVHKKN